jgi:pimeloyl-ACP methyl ester carboxylesterase
VRQVVRLLDALDLAECAVVGSSYGGLIAGLLALQQPKRVRRLVIVGSGSALHPPQLQQQVLRAVKTNAMKAIDGGTLEDCRKRLRSTAFEGRSVHEAMLPGLLTSNALPGRRESAERFYDALIASAVRDDCQTWPRLEAISMPTLIVTGRNDIRASWEQAVQASTRIPDCRIEIFEACGHGPMAEHPERFNEILQQFLQPRTGRADAPRVAPPPLH